MIYFHNPGEIDPRTITTFGVNVKPGTDSPIGYFGTGLKYALAVTLRLGGTVTIWSGLRQHTFTAQREAIRGKEFALVYMTAGDITQPLGFTLELGKSWKPWMAYREFYCNALDEQGDVTLEATDPAEGYTVIAIDCPELEAVHTQAHEYFLAPLAPRLAATPGLEILPGPATAVFYRGIRVLDLETPALFTYNILKSRTLTEDRTLSRWSAKDAIAQGVGELTDTQLLTKILTAPQKAFEAELPYEMVLGWSNPSKEFIDTTANLLTSRRADVCESARAYVKAARPELVPPAVERLSAIEAMALAKARRACVALGHDVVAPVIITEDLGKGNLGLALDGKIYLARECFRLGTKMLTGTLLEEHLHLTRGVADGREMQNLLLNLLIGAAEEKLGEAL